MLKLWCIRYRQKTLLGWKVHYMEVNEHRVDSALKHLMRKVDMSKTIIEDIFVEYKYRK